MKLRLHHVNVVSDDMEELHAFYRDVLGLAELPMIIEDVSGQALPTGDEDDADARRRANAALFDQSNAAFFDVSGRDQLQVHIGRRQAYLGARLGHAVNPVLHGHIAFRTDDLNACRKALNEAGIPFSDYGEWVIKDWDQIFLTDPAGNVVEIQQDLRA
ncbi:VOC family protein [Pseudonocardia kujensis]|uniref:VOC family protein n=1 Tax=Pseudonocardia kujensis TaxID=1128675 RepID=UPI001E52D027|nr:VOC family protein [Pseudonocardia kujensis]MCE0765052.1 VOC family protein [Pseudonocardia kujensis]